MTAKRCSLTSIANTGRSTVHVPELLMSSDMNEEMILRQIISGTGGMWPNSASFCPRSSDNPDT